MPVDAPVMEIELSPRARADLAAWVPQGLDLAFTSECECVDWLATQVDRLPTEIVDALGRLRHVDVPDVVVLRGLPVDAFPAPPTPSRSRSPDAFAAEPADLLHGLAAAVLGEPIGYLGQQDGRIFNDIVPVAELATRTDRSGGSVHTFDLHTEDASLPLAPTHFGLFCVRVLGVGDALWVDNRRVAHSRRPYHPRFDGTDRWLKRLTVVPDVDALAPLLVAPRVVDNDRLASHAAELPADWGPIR